jgi:hypothetical protein
MSTHSNGLFDWEGALVVKPRAAWKMLSCSNTRGYELLAAGKLVSFLDGRSRKITVASIKDYIARHTTATPVEPPRRRRGRPRKSPAIAAEQPSCPRQWQEPVISHAEGRKTEPEPHGRPAKHVAERRA